MSPLTDHYQLRIEKNIPIWYPTDCAFTQCRNPECAKILPDEQFQRYKTAPELRKMGLPVDTMLDYRVDFCLTCMPQSKPRGPGKVAGVCTKCALSKPGSKFKRFYTLGHALALGYSGQRRVFYESPICKDCTPQTPYLASVKTRRQIEQAANRGHIPPGQELEMLNAKDKAIRERSQHRYRSTLNRLRALLRPLVGVAATNVSAATRAGKGKEATYAMACESVDILRSLARELKHGYTHEGQPMSDDPEDVAHMPGLSPALMNAMRLEVHPHVVFTMLLHSYVRQDTYMAGDVRGWYRRMCKAFDAYKAQDLRGHKKPWLLRSLEYAVTVETPPDAQAVSDHLATANRTSGKRSTVGVLLYQTRKQLASAVDGSGLEYTRDYLRATQKMYELLLAHMNEIGEEALRKLNKTGAHPLRALYFMEGTPQYDTLRSQVRKCARLHGEVMLHRTGPAPLAVQICAAEAEHETIQAHRMNPRGVGLHKR